MNANMLPWESWGIQPAFGMANVWVECYIALQGLNKAMLHSKQWHWCTGKQIQVQQQLLVTVQALQTCCTTPFCCSIPRTITSTPSPQIAGEPSASQQQPCH